MGMHGRYRHRGLLLGCELRVGRELAQTELVVDLFARRAQQRQAIKEILPPILPPVGIFEVVDLADLIMIDTVVPQSPLDERKALPWLDRRLKLANVLISLSCRIFSVSSRSSGVLAYVSHSRLFSWSKKVSVVPTAMRSPKAQKRSRSRSIRFPPFESTATGA